MIFRHIAPFAYSIAFQFMRNSWVASRKGKNNVSQMHFARKGEITEEMVFVAKRENLP